MRRHLRTLFLLAALAGCMWRGFAAAHSIKPPPAREIVRLQGWLARSGQEVAEAPHRISLVAMGEPLRFAVREWLRIDLTGRAPAGPVPPVLVLQGPPEMLSRVSRACPSQRVTLLGERRRGGRDLFLLAVDLCPPQAPGGDCAP